jgi:hypothetical protein
MTPRTFVLRCWWEHPPSRAPEWRCVVEEVGSSAGRHGFSSVEAALAFWSATLRDPSTEGGPHDDKNAP